MININPRDDNSNIYDSPLSYLDSNSIKKNDHQGIDEENNHSDDYINFKNSENSFELEDPNKEMKFEIYSTEESKNNSNKFTNNKLEPNSNLELNLQKKFFCGDINNNLTNVNCNILNVNANDEKSDNLNLLFNENENIISNNTNYNLANNIFDNDFDDDNYFLNNYNNQNNNSIFNNNISKDISHIDMLSLNETPKKVDLLNKQISKEEVLESLFTCKICKKILYSPFMCKTCGESACHSCFGKKAKNPTFETINKNNKFNFCKFCKNDNISIMPNFKILQLKEDISKNFKNYPYLEHSTLGLINKVKEFTELFTEYKKNFENKENEIEGDNSHVSNNNKYNKNNFNMFNNNNVNNSKNNFAKNGNSPSLMNPPESPSKSTKMKFNPFSQTSALYKSCFFPSAAIYERYMDLAKMKYINNMNNISNQNFIFNNYNNSVSNFNAHINNKNVNKTNFINIKRSASDETPSKVNLNPNMSNSSNPNVFASNLSKLINSNSTLSASENAKNFILMNSKFFIVRSIYKENLELSKKVGLWATTPFNETKLREAFKNQFVVLLFTHSNNSLFYGCAILDTFTIKDKILEKFNNFTWRNDRGINLGNLFKIIWVSDCEIPIYKLKAMNNPFNKNIPVLKSKDCQEVPFSIGSYIFKICEGFSRKTIDVIDYEQVSKSIMKRRAYNLIENDSSEDENQEISQKNF